jgi:hypothetical protein
MLRSLLTFKSTGFDVAPFASPLPPELGYREQAALIFREYGGLLAYLLQGRFCGQTQVSGVRGSEGTGTVNWRGDEWPIARCPLPVAFI